MKKKIKKIIKYFFLIVLLVTFVGLVMIGSLLFKYQDEASRLVSEGGEEIFKAQQTSLIYDCDGNLITSLVGEKDVYYLEFDEIPYMVKRALITTEDRKFYDHSGIDYFAIARAMLELVKNNGVITQGGSTITQQLSRNIYLSHEVSYERKLKEMLIARELEKQYDKNKILEFYINNIYFANGFYGIQAASKGYFSKTVEQLSMSEMVFLCAIPNNPSKYDPYLYMSETLERRDRILKQMYEQEDIDLQMYKQALEERITLKPAVHTTNNFIETYVRHSATLALMEKDGFVFEYSFENEEAREEYYNRYYESYDVWSQKLYTGGYRIYTSIDLKKQEELQRIIDDNLAFYKTENNDGVYEFQGAAACVDNKTGRIVAIVGGRSEENSGYTINRAYQSHRQPGSTIKPLIVYTPLLGEKYTPESILRDEPVKDGPVNSPNVYAGDITLRYAVETSKNTTAWVLFQELTPEKGLGYLQNMNFTKIYKQDFVPAASIGGMTYGVSPVEMAEAYSTLENDGMFRNSTCIVKITDADNNKVISGKQKEKRVYEENASRMMTDILKGVLTSGTGKKYNISNAICAAKTGTTNENKDVWFVGYSTYYTTAVWCGYDNPKEINDGYGTTCSGNIWSQFMTYLHKELEMQDFLPYTAYEKEEESSSQELSSHLLNDEDSEFTSGLINDEEDTLRTEGNEENLEDNSEYNREDDTKDDSEYNGENSSDDNNENDSEDNSEEEVTAPGDSELYTEYWGE